MFRALPDHERLGWCCPHCHHPWPNEDKRANREARRNHATDVTCHVQKWVDSNSGMIWAAETKSSDGPTDRISAGFGCVALLENPDLRLPDEVREEWTDHVAGEPNYGKLIRVDGEDDVLDRSG